MSERILDFEKAEESADHTDDAAWHISYNRALEAQAQVRLTALESEWDKTHDEEVALLGRLVVEYRTRAEAAEAKLTRVREYVQECERESLPPLLHHLTEMLND